MNFRSVQMRRYLTIVPVFVALGCGKQPEPRVPIAIEPIAASEAAKQDPRRPAEKSAAGPIRVPIAFPTLTRARFTLGCCRRRPRHHSIRCRSRRQAIAPHRLAFFSLRRQPRRCLSRRPVIPTRRGLPPDRRRCRIEYPVASRSFNWNCPSALRFPLVR